MTSRRHLVILLIHFYSFLVDPSTLRPLRWYPRSWDGVALGEIINTAIIRGSNDEIDQLLRSRRRGFVKRQCAKKLETPHRRLCHSRCTKNKEQVSHIASTPYSSYRPDRSRGYRASFYTVERQFQNDATIFLVGGRAGGPGMPELRKEGGISVTFPNFNVVESDYRFRDEGG